MNKIILTRIAILGLFVTSSLLLFLKDTLILSILAIIILSAGFTFSKKLNLASRVYSLLTAGILILLFQLFFNISLSILDRFFQGFNAFLKIFSLSMLVFIFTEVFSINQIVNALSFLPSKIRLVLVITFSMIPTIFAEGQKILLVQNSRGHNTRQFNIIKSLIPFMIPLFHRVLRRAEQISLTIYARGYHE